ncbi:MAG: zf-HC2 domain-containing protein [Candidatus Aminicenantes bacterium]|nr:MAG: zf-HC2 domain-containing protein [Candidatus Aminicenantes bacterium]
MKCLGIDQIYLYLEKELSSEEKNKIEEHLAVCLKCKNAFEERSLLLEASDSLPLWQPPPDFTQQVMARIYPDKVTLREWLTALAVGFSSVIAALFAFFMITGQNLMTFLISSSHTLWNSVKNVALIFTKLFKLASLLINIIGQLAGYILENFARLTSLISPEIQIIIITFSIILFTSIIIGIRRKILIGEKS